MPVNQQSPNPETTLEKLDSISKLIENSVDSVNGLSLKTGSGGAGRFLSERMTMLRGLVNEVDRPILKSMATDMLAVMANWFEDPEVLCCLINAIFVAYTSSKDDKAFRVPENFEIQIADTTFADFLDKLISFIELIMAFIAQDLKKLVFFIPDFIKEIFQMVMGAILLVLQETLFTIRDSVLQSILDWVNSSIDADSLWASCLPMQQFLNILKTYVHDYGFFAELFEKIRGFVAGRRSAAAAQQLGGLIPKSKDMVFLEWFRDLLIKLKQAVINFELCVEYTFIPNDENADDGIGTETGTSILDPSDPSINTDVPAEDKVNLIVSDDGQTIAIDNNDTRVRNDDLNPNSLNKSTGNTSRRNGTYISRLSNDSVINFVKNNYGFSEPVVEQALKNAGDGCPGFPGGAELKDYLNRTLKRV